MAIKLVFLGTPEFAVPSLQALLDADDIEVAMVISQPDRPVGRKQVLTPPPVKLLASEHDVLVCQPEKLNKDQELINKIKELAPDFLVTCAYGQIIKQEILDLAPTVNVHASLLPDFRGPAPINWMIIHGEKIVGVTTMLTDPGVDTGDILLKAKYELGENETALDLAKVLSEKGARLLLSTLRQFSEIKPMKQSEFFEIREEEEHGGHLSEKRLAPFMDKKLGEVDFSKKEFILGSANPRQSDFKVTKSNTAQNIHNLVRALQAWPGAYFNFQGQKIALLDTRVISKNSTYLQGQVSAINKENSSFNVQTEKGQLEIIGLKPQGKSELSGFDWLNGKRIELGSKL